MSNSEEKEVTQRGPQSVEVLVGKRLFTVDKSELEKYKNSTLFYEIDKAPDQVPDDGEPHVQFIERSDKYFPSILDFISGDLNSFVGWTRSDLEELMNEAGHFNIRDLYDMLYDLLVEDWQPESLKIFDEKLEIFYSDKTLMDQVKLESRPTFRVLINEGESDFMFDYILRIKERIEHHRGPNDYGIAIGLYRDASSWGVYEISLVDPWTHSPVETKVLRKEDFWYDTRTLDDFIIKSMMLMEEKIRDSQFNHWPDEWADLESIIKKDPEVADASKRDDPIISLLNEGRYFKVPKSILLSKQNSYFSKLVSDAEDGSRFIIRESGKYFPAILKYLSGHELQLVGYSRYELDSFYKEAKSFGLTDLAQELLVLIKEADARCESLKRNYDRLEVFHNEETMLHRIKLGSIPTFCLEIDKDSLKSYYTILSTC